MFQVVIKSSTSENADAAFNELMDSKLAKEKPAFIFLASTVHFVKNGTIEKLLYLIDSHFSGKVPIVGGTFSGFISRHGCFIKGIALLAVFSDELTAFKGIGFNTKRNPSKAALNCSRELKSKMLDAKYYNNNFILLNVSNGIVPPFPFIGRKRVVQLPIPDSWLLSMLKTFGFIFQVGVGREKEILDGIASQFPDTSILCAANHDDNNALSDYQFYGNKVFKNSVVGLLVSTKKNILIETIFGLTMTDKKFKINGKSVFDCTFSFVNDKKGKTELLRIFDWPIDYLNESIYRKTYYFPIGYSYNNTFEPHTIALFLNDSICTTFPLVQDELTVFSASGNILKKELLESIEKIAAMNPEFILGIACTSYLETLGHNVYKLKDIFDSMLPEKNYLLVFTAGEGLTINNQANLFNHSIILSAFY